MKAAQARELMKQPLDSLMEEIATAAKKGYDGLVRGIYLAEANVKHLESLGYKVKTYTDGEFEETTITW